MCNWPTCSSAARVTKSEAAWRHCAAKVLKESVNLTTGGVRLNLDLGKAQIGPSWLSVRGALAYTHASGDLQPSTQAAWDGAGVMTVSGAPLDRLSTRMELGATARLTRASAIDLSFTRQRGERTRDQSLTAQYTLQF